MGRKHNHKWSGCYAPPGVLDGPRGVGGRARNGMTNNGERCWWRYCYKCLLVHKVIVTGDRNAYSRRVNQYLDYQNWYAELPDLKWKLSKRIPRECRS